MRNHLFNRWHQAAKPLFAACLLSVTGASPALAAGELRLYNWFDYMPQSLLDRFSEQHGVTVTVDTYDSNETLLARLKAGVQGYDLAVPGDYMVEILIKENLLEKVEPNQLENFKHIKPELIDVYFDPGRHYSIPYQFGTTSFMVNSDAYDGDINTLAILFDTPEPLRGRVNVLKDINDVINAGLRYLGYPRCNDNPTQLKEVNNLLQKAKANWLSFNSDGAKEVLVSGDADVGMIWNGFGLRARMEKSSLRFAYPKEGLTAWMDNLVVVKGAPNIDNAKAFLDFMLEPKNAAELTNFAMYTAGVVGAEPYLTEELRNAAELNPPQGAPQPEFVPPCEPKVVKYYDQIWTNLLK